MPRWTDLGSFLGEVARGLIIGSLTAEPSNLPTDCLPTLVEWVGGSKREYSISRITPTTIYYCVKSTTTKSEVSPHGTRNEGPNE